MKTVYKIPIILSIIVIVLAVVASLGGMVANNIYRDNELVKAVWLGNDIVTLFVAIPTMIGALFFSLRNSLKARLIWMGTLWYMVYNYIFYMYGAAFNKFFLFYVIIFTLSIYALILALMKIDIKSFKQKISSNIPVKWISSYMLFFTIMIGGLWIAQSLGFVFTNKVPLGITQTGSPSAVVFATDLSLLVSTLIVGAILLLKRDVWGYIVSIISLTKCFLYPFVLVIGGMIAYQKTGSWDSLTPLYILLWIGSLLSYIYLLKGIKGKE